MRTGSTEIGINAAYLKDLADALGSEEIVLECGGESEAILVRPIRNGEGALGLIMPIRLNERRNQ